MHLYTFIFEFDGGTYIAQLEAHSEEQALALWAERLEPGTIPHFTEDMKREMLAALEENGAVPINGARNTWCTTFSLGKRRGLINFVRTAR
jgi:hypothetical protein